MAKMSKKKQNEKKKKVLLLFVLLLGITIGFATLTQQLKINGTSKIKANTWDLELDPEDDDVITCPTGEVCTINPQDETPPRNPDDLTPDDGNGGEPICEDENDPSTCHPPVGAVIWMDGNDVNFKHLLSVPGDVFTFNTTFTNNGSVDAKIASTELVPLNNDALEYFTYSVTYADGTAVATNDVLAAGESATFKVTVAYKSSITTLPDAAKVAAINEDGNGATSRFTVNYVQA